MGKNISKGSILETLEIENPVDKKSNAGYFSLAEEVGFKTTVKIGEGYAQIKESAIHAFLKKKLLEVYSRSGDGRFYFEDKKTDHRCYRYFVQVDKYKTVNWDEQPIGEYIGTPPKYILESAKKAKECGFVDLRVVTVTVKDAVADKVTDSDDPLLIARYNSAIFLIDWWDNDFTAEDIANLV